MSRIRFESVIIARHTNRLWAEEEHTKDARNQPIHASYGSKYVNQTQHKNHPATITIAWRSIRVAV